jgi:hypothetical protein
MVNVKEMPSSEKYTMVQDSIKHEESLIPSFIQKYLGVPAENQLREIWSDGIQAIPENASDEERYEAAYSNWISMGKSSFKFVRENLGEDGIEKLKRADVESLKKANDSPALLFLSAIRVFSSGLVFSMIAKKIAYQLQWLSPYTVSELSHQRMIFDIPKCKLLDYPDTDDLCYIG